jgi:Mg-chelatase subunit ChlD
VNLFKLQPLSKCLAGAALVFLGAALSVPFVWAAPDPPKHSAKMLQLTLHAGVFVKLLEAGLDCIPESKLPLPALVNSVKIHSQAENEGMREGDRILSVSVHPDQSIDVTIDRAGQTYSLRLDTNPDWGKGWKNKSVPDSEKTEIIQASARPSENAAVAPAPLLADITPSTSLNYPGQSAEIQPSNTNDELQLSVQEQEKILGQHEVIVMIDKSGSMNTRDCPGGLSRWEWCAEQATALSKESEEYWPEGITLVVFSNDFDVYPHAHVKEVADVFKNYAPEGSTNTGSALWDRLRAYLNQRAHNPKKTKPLVIAVITDGEPTDGRTTQDAIISATGQMQEPADISITFLQVGNGATGAALLDELADKLVDEGARYDIVEHETFSKLQRMGLRRALVSAIVAPHVKPQLNGDITAHSDSFFERLRQNLEKKWLKHQPKNAF